ncbi:MAG: secretin N-terminal domain-containing protein [Candidatus Omnitrophota bacterium]
MKKYKIVFIGALLLLIFNPLNIFAQEYTETSAESEDLISLSFQDADINQAIKVLGDLTGTIIIPNEDLKGTISIVSMEKVKPDTVINVLESALMIRGFTVVKSGEALKIVPISDIKQSNVEVQIGSWPGFIKDQDIVITQVMPLKYSSAIKIKNELQSLIGKHGNILANERTNTIIITDSSSNIKRLATIISQVDRPLPAAMQVKTFVVNYGDAVKIAKILNDLSKEDKEARYPEFSELGLGDIPLEVFGGIEAYSEEETNSIVVATALVNFPAIERLINKLDVFPPQAMIEVVLMDVTLSDDLTMGVEYGSSTNPTLTTEGIKSGSNDQNIFHSLLNLSTEASTQGFTYRILSQNERTNLLGFILKTQENTKVLSTPRILASNNQESSITVGQEIPIIESSVTDLVNNVTTVNFKYQDVGLGLKVTPRISQDGFVNLKVHAELKDLSAKTLFDASIINKREANATVMVPDGYTVVLGGLMRDNDSIIENKVPLLGDIPFLGNLFKKTKTTTLKTELLIFLSPKILKSIKELQEITQASKDKLDIIGQAQTTQELKSAVKTTVDPKAKKLIKENQKIKNKHKKNKLEKEEKK